MACNSYTPPTSPCNTPAPCQDCGCTDQYNNTGCLDYLSTDCVTYHGVDIIEGDVTIQEGDILTDIIAELVKNANDVDLNMTWNSTIRTLSLLKNNVVIKTIVIPDQDDQYLYLTQDKLLQIFKPVINGTDVKTGEVDLSTLYTQTALNLKSDSLAITPQGPLNTETKIELQPSSDAGNGLILGTDRKPYVPSQIIPVANVNIVDGECITTTKSVINGVITFTTSVDWQCVADKVCGLCDTTCDAPTGLNVESI